jgi:hypothetical protein
MLFNQTKLCHKLMISERNYSWSTHNVVAICLGMRVVVGHVTL